MSETVQSVSGIGKSVTGIKEYIGFLGTLYAEENKYTSGTATD